MKIISLTAENVKRLKAVYIEPQGNMVEITGRNGQGKTSILDSLWWCLAGQAAIQGQPIRTGENKARIRLDLGEIIVTRKFKRHDDGEVATEIIVENAEGVRFGSPQRMLDALLGQLSFDPLAFARMTAREQYDTLRRFVPDVDFDAIEKANREDFDRRTAVNREAKEARAQAAGIHVDPNAPKEPVDEQAIVQELAAASERNAQVARLEAQDAARGERLAALHNEIVRLTKEHDDLVRAPRPEIPARVDVDGLRRKAEAAHLANEKHHDRQRRDDLNAKADEAERKSAALTAGMQERERQKQQAIAAAAMPVPDLSFGDGEVLKAGVPFEQASDAEKLRASVAIAMAMNPKLRVIRIRDGSLLDAASLALVSEMAKDQDCQVWIERVADDRSVGFVIEDGSVVAAPQMAAEVAP